MSSDERVLEGMTEDGLLREDIVVVFVLAGGHWFPSSQGPGFSRMSLHRPGILMKDIGSDNAETHPL